MTPVMRRIRVPDNAHVRACSDQDQRPSRFVSGDGNGARWPQGIRRFGAATQADHGRQQVPEHAVSTLSREHDVQQRRQVIRAARVGIDPPCLADRAEEVVHLGELQRCGD